MLLVHVTFVTFDDACPAAVIIMHTDIVLVLVCSASGSDWFRQSDAILLRLCLTIGLTKVSASSSRKRLCSVSFER